MPVSWVHHRKLKGKQHVPEERLVGVCAFDAVGTLETVAELEGRNRRKRGPRGPAGFQRSSYRLYL
jgi:hypothetical protein